MPKKFLRKCLPDPHKITQSKSLRIFGNFIHEPNLWHMNRKSVSMAFMVGMFFMWVPLPSQMILAAGAAILLRCNLPLSVALVWITNPITMAPMFYSAYILGNWMLGSPPSNIEFEASFEWISQQMDVIWKPFLLGCFTLGVSSSIIGFVGIRMLWRLHIVNYLKNKKQRFVDKHKKQK
ncbi:MAG: DUF2062 domain-containing protein [endosymbiont of Galathealinum brachiosum]|uniref:DUF2062 domain-containing protein n=1 Tax=endosymbiont of Galathealinum brachiosum TaxID=2200906 RepID=A0A370DGF8_9GAMM|nr:MAG: DUF2062 domain-containing protein [endosymbiont of Galathealinum brachiosum]